jgi:hypothetical protein
MRRFAFLAALILGACAQPGAPPPPPSTAAYCTAPLRPALEVDLFFGRDKQGGGEVSDTEWAAFLAEVVTPRFPRGLSVLDVEGQTRTPSGSVERERAKLLIAVVFDAPAHQSKVREVIDAYNGRFDQRSVFRSERPVCAGF